LVICGLKQPLRCKISVKSINVNIEKDLHLAGETGLEPATYGYSMSKIPCKYVSALLFF